MAASFITPAIRLQYAIIGLVILWGVVLVIALYQPSSQLQVEVSAQQKLSVYWQQQPLFHDVTSIEVADSVQQTRITLTATDFIEDPHFVSSYAQMQQFFQRQQQLHQLLGTHSQIVLSSGSNTTSHTVDIAPKRTLQQLPVVFWFQLVVSSLGFLLGCWIWALRPQETATRVFALLNAMYPVFAFPAAIYSTRDLALSSDLFRVLVCLNTGGALLYGCALVSLFLVYPKQLVKTYYLWMLPVFFFIWWLLDTLYLLPEPSMGGDLPVTLQMLGAILCMLWQWRISRQDPHARVALRWFAAWILVSAGVFVFLVQSTQLLEIDLNMSQGYSFGLFLLATIGIAIGLRRYQLFNLDRWAFGILYWLAGAIALVVLDAMLVMMLSPLLSLSLAVLICGLLWLPTRSWIQSLLFKNNHLSDNELFERVLLMSFSVNEVEREKHWQHFLQDVFQPLNIEEYADELDTTTRITENGLTLNIPHVAGLSARRLSYPRQGRGLFNHYDQKLVNNALQLIAYAAQSRTAYDQGVAAERQRIARDLHDDVGARLLSGLQQKDVEHIRKSIRAAISEMRTIISGLVGEGIELNTILDELQLEIAERLQSSDITLHWSQELAGNDIRLSYTQYKHYVSILRELVSNIIKYANTHQVTIHIALLEGHLLSWISDDGAGFNGQPDEDVKQRYGLQNLQKRSIALAGMLKFETEFAIGSKVELRFPVS